MSTHSTPLADAHDAALDLASLAEMLSQEVGSRVSRDENSDGLNIAALAQLLSERLAAHRDRLEALANTPRSWAMMQHRK